MSSRKTKKKQKKKAKTSKRVKAKRVTKKAASKKKKPAGRKATARKATARKATARKTPARKASAARRKVSTGMGRSEHGFYEHQLFAASDAYSLVESSDPSELVKQVQIKCNDGWQTIGGVCHSGSSFYQALTKAR